MHLEIANAIIIKTNIKCTCKNAIAIEKQKQKTPYSKSNNSRAFVLVFVCE